MLDRTLDSYRQINWFSDTKADSELQICTLHTTETNFDDIESLHQHLRNTDCASGWVGFQSNVCTIIDSMDHWKPDKQNLALLGEFVSGGDTNKSWRFCHTGVDGWRLVELNESPNTADGDSSETYLMQPFEYQARSDTDLGTLKYRVYWQSKDHRMQRMAARFTGFETPAAWQSNKLAANN